MTHTLPKDTFQNLVTEAGIAYTATDVHVEIFDEDDGFVCITIPAGTYTYRELDFFGWKPRQVLLPTGWVDVAGADSTFTFQGDLVREFSDIQNLTYAYFLRAKSDEVVTVFKQCCSEYMNMPGWKLAELRKQEPDNELLKAYCTWSVLWLS